MRASAFGYFGHMWGAVCLFVLIPAIVATRFQGCGGLVGGDHDGAGRRGLRGGAARWRGASAARAWRRSSRLQRLGLLAPWLLEAPLWAWVPGCCGGAPPCRAIRRSSARSLPPTRRARWWQRAHLRQRHRLSTLSTATITLFAALAAQWPLAQVLPWLDGRAGDRFVVPRAAVEERSLVSAARRTPGRSSTMRVQLAVRPDEPALGGGHLVAAVHHAAFGAQSAARAR